MEAWSWLLYQLGIGLSLGLVGMFSIPRTHRDQFTLHVASNFVVPYSLNMCCPAVMLLHSAVCVVALSPPAVARRHHRQAGVNHVEHYCPAVASSRVAERDLFLLTGRSVQCVVLRHSIALHLLLRRGIDNLP